MKTEIRILIRWIQILIEFKFRYRGIWTKFVRLTNLLLDPFFFIVIANQGFGELFLLPWPFSQHIASAIHISGLPIIHHAHEDPSMSCRFHLGHPQSGYPIRNWGFTPLMTYSTVKYQTVYIYRLMIDTEFKEDGCTNK